MGENIIPWTVGVGVARRVEQPSDVLPPMRLGELVAFVEAPPGYRGPVYTHCSWTATWMKPVTSDRRI